MLKGYKVTHCIYYSLIQQRSTLFFLRLCSFIARQFIANDINVKSASKNESKWDKNGWMYLAILSISSMFNEFCRHEGFGIFATVGGLGMASQEFFFAYIFNCLRSQLSLYSKALFNLHPDVKPSNLRLYVTDNEIPNIISPLHLISQSLNHEYITNSFYID